MLVHRTQAASYFSCQMSEPGVMCAVCRADGPLAGGIGDSVGAKQMVQVQLWQEFGLVFRAPT